MLQSLFPRDSMTPFQPLLEIKIFKKSDMNFSIIKTSSDWNCAQLVQLLRESEVTIGRAG